MIKNITEWTPVFQSLKIVEKSPITKEVKSF